MKRQVKRQGKRQRAAVHPARAPIHETPGLANRAADAITAFVGSWLFVGIHAVWFTLWIVLRIEPFPFGLLTLLVSFEAIFLSTFIMMSQNRTAEKDRHRDDLEAVEVEELTALNHTQLRLLTAIHELTVQLAAMRTDGETHEARDKEQG